MRAVLRGMLAAGGILGVALTASCQTSAGTVVGTVTGTVGTGSAVAGRPYTAHFRITSEQTLANGTTITRETTEINARDSQGEALSQLLHLRAPTGSNARSYASPIRWRKGT